MSQNRKMHLALVIGDSGFHQAAWRLPEGRVDQLAQLKLFQDVAQRAEKAALDSLFVADVLGFDPSSVESWPTNQLEPITLLSALAAVTDKIGLIATHSSTFTPPYTIARQILSLDHLSQGRAGWNVVTSRAGNEHYGLNVMPSQPDRYARAKEVVQVAKALWTSWDADTIIADREFGQYGDAKKIHPIDFSGKYVSVKGALPSPRSVQGQPVIVQAGSSENGRDFAAEHADIVFTMQPDAEEAGIFYQDIKQRAKKYGRHPDDIKVFQGITPFAAESIELAENNVKRLAELADLNIAKKRLSALFALPEIEQLAVDQPVPEVIRHKIDRQQLSTAAVKVLAEIDKLLPLEHILHQLLTSRGHWTPVGTFQEIAAQMQQRFDQGQVDGFVVLPSDLDAGLSGFLEGIVPILQTRKVFRTEYAGHTLRDHLGISYPV